MYLDAAGQSRAQWLPALAGRSRSVRLAVPETPVVLSERERGPCSDARSAGEAVVRGMLHRAFGNVPINREPSSLEAAFKDAPKPSD